MSVCPDSTTMPDDKIERVPMVIHSKNSKFSRPDATRSLGGRMALATLGFCFIFALLAISLRSWTAWEMELAAMNSDLDLIQKVYQPTLSKAIWEFDGDSLNTHLDSAIKVAAIGQIVVKLPRKVYMRAQPGWSLSRFAPERHLPLT